MFNLYSKVVLTVIAAALVAIAARSFTPPPFDPLRMQNLGELVTAYRAGYVTKEQAIQIAADHGWGPVQ